jgi:hypothetical protein
MLVISLLTVKLLVEHKSGPDKMFSFYQCIQRLYAHLLAYLPNPWSRVLLEKLTGL